MINTEHLISESGVWGMGRNKKKKSNAEQYDKRVRSMPVANEKNSVTKGSGGVFRAILTQVLVTIIASTVSTVLVSYRQLGVVENDIAHLAQNMKDMQTDISALRTDMDKIKTDVSGLQVAVADLQEMVYNTHTINLTSSAVQSMQIVRSKNDISTVAAPAWRDTDVIGTDVSTGKTYTAEELKNTTLLIPYTQNGQEVYFLGQFSDNIRWDGKCIINVYEDDRLVLITEAVYDDGTMLSYKQVLPDVNHAEKKVWLISDRECINEVNSGETWSYIRESDRMKAFTIGSVLVSDILDVAEFRETIDLQQLEGFYYGNTSEGTLNDDTGEAYIVKYFEDGTVRTLYRGRVKDGVFNDDTNNAWYITKEQDTSYMYYKGAFKNGIVQNNTGSEFINPISLEEIQKIIQGQDFKCELKWQEN